MASRKIKRAGMELSAYFMPGLGERHLSRDNARETADALNQINPDFIRLRTLALPEGTPLAAQHQSGEFDKMGEVETAEELLLFLENQNGIESTVKSDHVLNLFSEVEGRLPRDKAKMISTVRRFLQLSPEQQMIFSIGRRTHRMSKLADLGDPTKYPGSKLLSKSSRIIFWHYPGRCHFHIESVLFYRSSRSKTLNLRRIQHPQ